MTTHPPKPRLTILQRADLLDSGPELLRANSTAFAWKALALLLALVCLGAWACGWYVTGAQFYTFNFDAQGRAVVATMPASKSNRLTLHDTAQYRPHNWPARLAQELKTCRAAPHCWRSVGGALAAVCQVSQVQTARQVSQVAGGAFLLALIPAIVGGVDVALWERRERQAQRRVRRARKSAGGAH